MDNYWIPGVNQLGSYGRWAFQELTEVYRMEVDFATKVEEAFDAMLSTVASVPA